MNRARRIPMSLLLALTLGASTARALPTIVYDGSIVGTDPVDITAITGFPYLFLTSFDGGLATSTSITGFTSIPDSPPGTSVQSFTLDDMEVDLAQTVRTGNSVDFLLTNTDAGPVTIDFGEGVIGVNFQAVSRTSIQGTELVAERFDGSFQLQATAGITPLGQQVFDEIDALSGGTGSPIVAFSGAVTSSSPFDGSTQTVFYTTTLVPVAAVETVVSGSQVNTNLLGGTGEAGGISIMFDDSGTGGQLTASFEELDVAATEAIIDDPTTTAADLGIFFAGGQSQIWDVEFTGDIDGPITLVLSYDDTFFGPTFDETVLGVVHRKDDGTLEIFYPNDVVIDPVANTIELTTDSFSPFILTAQVPEPSLASLALAAALGTAFARRRGRARAA